MSLLQQKKENDRKVAEAAAKAREEAILCDLAVHPVIKLGCSREIRDAYFHGLVFAAIADDEKVDADERAILDGIAKSIGYSQRDVDDVVSSIMKMSIEGKLQLIEECVRTIKEHETLVKLFYAQFCELWMTGEYNLDELREYADMFKNWSGLELSSDLVKNIKLVVSNSTELNSALDTLAVWMGEDELKHFALHRYGNVTARIEMSQKNKRDAVDKTAVENELHKLQSVWTEECGKWGSMHYEWSEAIKKQLSVCRVELLDLKSEALRVLNDQPSNWNHVCADRWRIGKMAILIICKYMVKGKSFKDWWIFDDMFKAANRRSIREDLTQLAKKEFGIQVEDRNTDFTQSLIAGLFGRR